METGKPDQVGTLGEEVVGPIDLPRSGSSFWSLAWLVAFLSAIISIGLEELTDFLVVRLDWTQAQAHFYKPFVALSVLGAVFGAAQWAWNVSRPRFRIERGHHVAPVTEEPLKFRENYSKVERLLFLGLLCCGDAVLVWALFHAFHWYARLFVALILAGCVAATWNIYQFSTRPLLILDEEGALVQGR
ncbi:MAG TPA: hypothetical protein VF627_01190, partial [Abditibacterium sp.]